MRRMGLSAFIILIALPAACSAGLHVQVGNASIEAGNTAYIDVTITSDSSDQLNNFNFQFQIFGGTPGGLSFVDPQPNTYLSDSSYIFFGDSADLIQAANVGAVTTTTTPGDTYSGSDNLLTTTVVTVGSTPELLVRLEVQASAAILNRGGPYTISLISAGTGFYDYDFDQINPVTASPGSVSFVPEPSTLVMGTLALAISLVSIRRSRRQG